MEVEEKPKKLGTAKRKRMKAVQAKIREQMEFYFSDSNLAKDRFMKNLIQSSENGYVDMETFLTFKKISSLTKDVIQIRKALSHSDFFELNEDKTKVKRKTPIQELKDLDEKTVYVECLPKTADHQWLRKLFSPCGNITYISIPKFKSTGDKKGFAFVEFDSVEAAKRACQELNNPPVRPGERFSPGMFPRYNKQLVSMQKKLEEIGDNDIEDKLPDASKLKRGKRQRSKASESSTDLSDISPKKRRNTLSTDSLDSQGDSTGPVKRKRKRRESEGEVSQRTEGESGNSEDKSNSVKKGKKRKQKSVSDTSASESDVSKSGDVSGTENERRRKTDTVGDQKGEKTSREDNSSTTKSTKQGNFESESKMCEDQQRKRRADEKSDSYSSPKKLPKVTSGGQSEETSKGTPTKKKEKRKRKKKHKEKGLPELRVIPKLEWLYLKKEYLNLQKESMKNLKQSLTQMKMEDSSEQNKEHTQEAMLEKPTVEMPGTVVRLSSECPVYRKQLKTDLGPETAVAYVDVLEGEKEGFVRFKDTDSATKVIGHSWPHYHFTLLTGTDEEMYWNKLKADKMKKYESKQKKSEKRGQKKLIDRAQKRNKENMDRVHIRFSEDE